MVYKQAILYLLVLGLNYSCNNNRKSLDLEYKNMFTVYNKQNKENFKYCFSIILDSLNTKEPLDNNKYLEISESTSLYKLYKNHYYDKIIEDFNKYHFFTEKYILENSNTKYLILIGQTKGATGIGVNYWNYECFPLNKKDMVIKFSSLSKTPLSIFFNTKNQLRYLTIDDNYPHPASGTIQLDYYPIISYLYNNNNEVINKINLNCK
jgi:hypothetical protein